MNTFGSDLNKILSAREQAYAVGGVSTDVPVVKADTIKKAERNRSERNKSERNRSERNRS